MCYYCLLCGNRGIGIEWVELGRECHLEFLHNSSLLSCPSPWFRVDSVCHHNDSKPKIFHANSFWGGRKCPPSPCSLRKGMLYLDCWKLEYYIHIARESVMTKSINCYQEEFFDLVLTKNVPLSPPNIFGLEWVFSPDSLRTQRLESSCFCWRRGGRGWGNHELCFHLTPTASTILRRPLPTLP